MRKLAMLLLVGVAACHIDGGPTGPVVDPTAPTNLGFQLAPSGDPNVPLGILLSWDPPTNGRAAFALPPFEPTKRFEAQVAIDQRPFGRRIEKRRAALASQRLDARVHQSSRKPPPAPGRVDDHHRDPAERPLVRQSRRGRDQIAAGEQADRAAVRDEKSPIVGGLVPADLVGKRAPEWFADHRT